jgi:glyoxylase-like metal-dependent hydrolase (beta-lactamase superfamily II)
MATFNPRKGECPDAVNREGASMKVEQVADGLFRAGGTDVNWYLVKEGTDLTLVDAGYPGDTAAVLASIEAVGCKPGDVRALLLTHAHVDHMGEANHLHDEYGVPTLMDPAEVPHARREVLEQAGPLDVARQLWRPGVLPWSLRITRAGATKDVRLPHAQAFPTDGTLDVPGGPVPVATHGHTSGHSAYLFPALGAVATGDALVTGHAVSRHTGPQLIPEWFNHAPIDPREGLAPLADVDADVVLPGHGSALRVPVREAVMAALSHERG